MAEPKVLSTPTQSSITSVGKMNEININERKIDLTSIQNPPPEPAPSEEPAPEPVPEQVDEPLPEIQEVYEDPVEKRKLIKEISMYAMSRLNKHLTLYDLRPAALEMKSIPELTDLKREICYCVGVRSNLAFVNTAFNTAIETAEFGLTKFTPLKVQGLAHVLRQSEEAQDVICEIALKHQNLSYVEPEYRLAMILGQTIIGLHQLNKGTEVVNEALSQPVSNQLDEQYADL